MKNTATFKNDQGRTIRPSKLEMKAVKNCPGYTGEGVYMVCQSANGETRLYKYVGHLPMDASLRDVPELAKFAKRNRI